MHCREEEQNFLHQKIDQKNKTNVMKTASQHNPTSTLSAHNLHKSCFLPKISLSFQILLLLSFLRHQWRSHLKGRLGCSLAKFLFLFIYLPIF